MSRRDPMILMKSISRRAVQWPAYPSSNPTGSCPIPPGRCERPAPITPPWSGARIERPDRRRERVRLRPRHGGFAPNFTSPQLRKKSGTNAQRPIRGEAGRLDCILCKGQHPRIPWPAPGTSSLPPRHLANCPEPTLARGRRRIGGLCEQTQHIYFLLLRLSRLSRRTPGTRLAS
jgi:hypothetical protein